MSAIAALDHDIESSYDLYKEPAPLPKSRCSLCCHSFNRGIHHAATAGVFLVSSLVGAVVSPIFLNFTLAMPIMMGCLAVSGYFAQTLADRAVKPQTGIYSSRAMTVLSVIGWIYKYQLSFEQVYLAGYFASNVARLGQGAFIAAAVLASFRAGVWFRDKVFTLTNSTKRDPKPQASSQEKELVSREVSPALEAELPILAKDQPPSQKFLTKKEKAIHWVKDHKGTVAMLAIGTLATLVGAPFALLQTARVIEPGYVIAAYGIRIASAALGSLAGFALHQKRVAEMEKKKSGSHWSRLYKILSIAEAPALSVGSLVNRYSHWTSIALFGGMPFLGFPLGFAFTHQVMGFRERENLRRHTGDDALFTNTKAATAHKTIAVFCATNPRVRLIGEIVMAVSIAILVSVGLVFTIQNEMWSIVVQLGATLPLYLAVYLVNRYIKDNSCSKFWRFCLRDFPILTVSELLFWASIFRSQAFSLTENDYIGTLTWGGICEALVYAIYRYCVTFTGDDAQDRHFRAEIFFVTLLPLLIGSRSGT